MEYRLIGVLGVLIATSSTSHFRPKRVINGEVLDGRPLTYRAIRYYGALGTIHGVFTLGGLLKRYETIMCSGSLITPVIFQTACHCISTFDVNDERIPTPVTVDHAWEGYRVVYLGVSKRFGEESASTYSPAYTEKFVIHQRCTRLGLDGPLVYDFGIIQLDGKWIKGDPRAPIPYTEIEYAPQYTEEDIKSYTRYALTKMLVCLQIGFGRYSRYSPRTSNFLRHGWDVLMPDVDCVERTARINGTRISDEDTKHYYSWLCSENFTKHEQEPGTGDSGSPYTCENRVIAVHSSKRSDYFRGRPYNIVAKGGALIYNLYVNAIEYRRGLINSILHMKETYRFPLLVLVNPRHFDVTPSTTSQGRNNEGGSYAMHITFCTIYHMTWRRTILTLYDA